eukprot:6594421-Pyramimonas_sp.AAC.1
MASCDGRWSLVGGAVYSEYSPQGPTAGWPGAGGRVKKGAARRAAARKHLAAAAPSPMDS